MMIRVFCVGLVFGMLSLGCNRGPKAIPALYVNAKSASLRALELYDTNKDGELDAEELKASPGLEYAAKRADIDESSSLSSDEIVEMIEDWNENSAGLLTLRCRVLFNKKPLAGASIRLEPEPVMNDQVETAIGLTDEFGDAYLTIPKENRPIADSPPGVQLGLYKVVISKEKDGKQIVPAKYNTATTLGQEVSFGDPGVQNGITFKLSK